MGKNVLLKLKTLSIPVEKIVVLSKQKKFSQIEEILRLYSKGEYTYLGAIATENNMKCKNCAGNNAKEKRCVLKEKTYPNGCWRIEQDKIDTQVFNYTGEKICLKGISHKCSFENCKEKVDMVFSVDDKIKGLPVEKLYPVCKKHKELILNNNATAPNSG